jgi:hypothetical protein
MELKLVERERRERDEMAGTVTVTGTVNQG